MTNDELKAVEAKREQLRRDREQAAHPERLYGGKDGDFQPREWLGCRYVETKGIDVRELAKLVRKDLATAVKLGKLPHDTKAAVRIRRYSMGQSIDVALTLPAGYPILNHERAIRDLQGLPNDPPLGWRSDLAEQWIAAAEAILDAYNFDDCDSQSDCFHHRFHSDVRITNDTEAERLAIREEWQRSQGTRTWSTHGYNRDPATDTACIRCGGAHAMKDCTKVLPVLTRATYEDQESDVCTSCGEIRPIGATCCDQKVGPDLNAAIMHAQRPCNDCGEPVTDLGKLVQAMLTSEEAFASELNAQDRRYRMHVVKEPMSEQESYLSALGIQA